jgi:hypothetical protein
MKKRLRKGLLPAVSSPEAQHKLSFSFRSGLPKNWFFCHLVSEPGLQYEKSKGFLMRRLPEEMEGQELARLCIATRTSEAREIEAELDRAGIDYTFEIAPVAGTSVLGILLGGKKKGVIFLIPESQHEYSVRLLEKAGLSYLLAE